MKKIIMIGLLIVSCSIWGCSESSSLSSKLRGNTFQAEGISEILALLSDCSGGGSTPVQTSPAMDPEPVNIDNDVAEESFVDESPSSETSVQTNEAESAAAESESALPPDDGGGYMPAGEVYQPVSVGAIPGSEPMQLKKTTGSAYEVTFADSTFTLKQGGQTALSGTWKVIDDDKIEITSNGETIPLDVEISGSTLMVDLPVGTSFSCSAGGSGGGGTTTPAEPAPSSSFEDEESNFDSTYGDYGDDADAEVSADEDA